MADNPTACEVWDCDEVLMVPDGKGLDKKFFEAAGWALGPLPGSHFVGVLCPKHLAASPLQVLIG